MRKSVWSFRTQLGKRHSAHTFIAITVALAIYYLTSDVAIGLLSLPNGIFRSWLESFYIALLFVLAIWVAALLNRKD